MEFVATRIKLRFPEVTKLLESFLKSFSEGKVAIPTKKVYEVGAEVELETYFPQLAEPQIFSGKVISQDPVHNSVQVQITSPDQVKAVFSMLAAIPAYQKLLPKPEGPKVVIEDDLGEEPEPSKSEKEAEVVMKSAAAPAPAPTPEKPKVEVAVTTTDSPAPAPAPAPEKLKAETYQHAPHISTPPPRVRHVREEIRAPRSETKVVSEPAQEQPRPMPGTPEKRAPKPSSGEAEVDIHIKAAPHAPAKDEHRTHIKEDLRPPRPEKTEPKKVEEVKVEKPPEEPRPEVKEPEPEKAPEKPDDAMGQLKDWLLIRDKSKEKKEDKKEEKKEEEKKEEEKKKEIDLEPTSDFTQDLVKAMLRSGYYSPDHPGSSDAKLGLFQSFTKAVGDRNELGFTLQHRVGQTPEIYISGVVEDPLPLKKLMGASTSELYFPKYLDYFNRKRLVSFILKRDLTKDHFNKFVDIMSDPTVDKGEASEQGRLLTRLLVENQISEISALFETDLIRLETNLPWNVEMAIQRLAKDLKVLPMFKNMSKADMKRLKMQIVQDIQRPLRRPELLKDIILNVYVIAMQIPGIDEEDLEETIILNFPLPMLLPTADFIIKEFVSLGESKPTTEDEVKLVERRAIAIKRILKRISAIAMDKEVEGTDKFLEQLFIHKVLTFEELPESVQEKVNNIKMTDEFQKQPPYWLSKFAEARNKEEIEIFLKYFSKIMPILIERKDWQSLYLITDAFQRIPPHKIKIFKEMGVENPTRAVWENLVYPLVRCLLDESAATRQGLEQIIHFLGEIGMQGIYDALLQEPDPAKRKILLENLLKFGPKALDLFRAILKDPTKATHLSAIALEALGRAKDPTDAEIIKRYLRHSRPELRTEAITATVRVLGWEGMPAISGMVSDKDPGVSRRAVAALGGFSTTHPEAKAKLVEIAFEGDFRNNLRTQAIHELGRSLPQSEDEKKELQDNLLGVVFEGEGFGTRLKRAFSGVPEDIEKLKLVSLDIVGKIGDADALKKLSKLSLSGEALKTKLSDVLKQLNLRHGVEEEK